MSHRAWAILFLLILITVAYDFWQHDAYHTKYLMIKGDQFIEWLAVWR